MNQEYYLQQLEEELVVALGCTEPVSVAFAGALARKETGYDEPIESIELQDVYKRQPQVRMSLSSPQRRSSHSVRQPVG